MQIQWLGSNRDYLEIYEQMKELLAQRVNGEIEDQLLLVEHNPVYTVGRARNAEQNLLSPNVPVERIERGGDVTFHGTGQLTGYPIVQLPVQDIHAYLRFLEEFWIAELALHNITATRDDRNTGVWVDGKKMVAIGVAMRRWVCWHGFACNLTVNRDYLRQINPCGKSSDLVTRWCDHQPPPDLEVYALELGQRFEHAWIEWTEKMR
jgi:lipoyl(octanoyl) transferase